MDEYDFDCFDEDEAERRYLLSKPACFVIFGKPGSGKTTLARKFAKSWKCQLVSVQEAINHAIQKETNSGLQAKKILAKGSSLPDGIALEILNEKLYSPEVQHHGYILDDFPSLAQDFLSVDDQIRFLKNLKLAPDYIINIKIPKQDLINRRTKLKVDPKTNTVYTAEACVELDKPKVTNDAQQENEEEGEGEEDNEEEEEEESDYEDEESVIDMEEVDEDIEQEEHPLSLTARLAVRTEDLEENVKSSVNMYNELLLQKLEDFMGDHDQQRVIELDGNIPAKQVFKNLLTRVNMLQVRRVAVPNRLQGMDEMEEVAEDTDTDDMLRTLAAAGTVAPGFRWKRSRWGRQCPVALADGKSILGFPSFAVSFLDKMYIMSSADALQKFISNPRRYLLPPQPAPPCKLIVLGAPLAGSSTISARLAERYHAQVFDVNKLMKPEISAAKQKMLDDLRVEVLQSSIIKVKALIDEHKGGKSTPTQKDDADVPQQELMGMDMPVDENHPEVQKLLSAALKTASDREVSIPPEKYIDCLEAALEKLYEGTDKGPSFGGWVLDNFPQTREQHGVMVDRGIIPDETILLKDESPASEVLHQRWHAKHADDEESDSKLKIFKKNIADFEKNWPQLQISIMNSSNKEPCIIPCKNEIDDAVAMAVKKIEGAFQYRGWEYTGMDQDEEEEDLALAAEDNEEEYDDEQDDDKRRPFGESKHFCPVTLKQDEVLCPGNPEIAAKFREKVYFFASAEARESFLENPQTYLPKDGPLIPPAIRLLLIGVKGSGKTLHGRLLAKKFKIFHISFKDRLQELIMHKTKKRIGPEYEEDEEDLNESSKDQADYAMNLETEIDEEEEEKLIEYTAIEENIRGNIMDDEPLTKETLDAILSGWWKEEPYKSTGFLLEGFPRTADEARYLGESGLFPDGAVTLSVPESDIYDRLMPPIFEKWKTKREKRIEMKLNKHIAKMKAKEEERAKRIAQKRSEIDARRAEKLARQEDEDSGEEPMEDDEDDLDVEELVDRELAEEEEDADEEVEDEEEGLEDAQDRIRGELSEKYELENDQLERVQEALDELMIPKMDVDASRKPSIVQYVIKKMLRQLVEFRSSMFNRCLPISPQLAKAMLIQGYKLPSRFRKWCPVQLYDGESLPRFGTSQLSLFPVIFRQYIYFISSEENRERFMQSPMTFLEQKSPGPIVPLRLAVHGPPKAGKTTLVNRLVQDYGLMHLSMGKALRKLMETHSHTELVKKIVEHLKKGVKVPDELAVMALDTCRLDPQCQIQGFVLDDYPVTESQVELLKERSIIPYKIINLDLTDDEVMKRGAADRKAPTRVLPLHDSRTILAIRTASHRHESVAVKQYYQEQHKNLFSLDGLKSKWWIYAQTVDEIQSTMKQIQTYIERTSKGKAASIKNLCVTPKELLSRLGTYGEYCPVSLIDDNELVDCSLDKSIDLVAEFRGIYYKLSSKNKLELFLSEPDKYVPPSAKRSLPSPENLPIRRDAAHVKKVFPQAIELQGYCPVTFLDGELRYEAIIPGDANFIAEYKNKLFTFTSEENLDKFMRQPSKYWKLKLPSKLPPKREPIPISCLPMLGYMEQTCSLAIVKAVTAVGNLKPKFPFMTARESALLFIAFHLKAHNPKASKYVREKYKKKLTQFQESCQLITYLGRFMKRRYLDPEDRPIDFDHKLGSFLSLGSAIQGVH